MWQNHATAKVEKILIPNLVWTILGLTFHSHKISAFFHLYTYTFYTNQGRFWNGSPFLLWSEAKNILWCQISSFLSAVYHGDCKENRKIEGKDKRTYEHTAAYDSPEEWSALKFEYLESDAKIVLSFLYYYYSGVEIRAWELSRLPLVGEEFIEMKLERYNIRILYCSLHLNRRQYGSRSYFGFFIHSCVYGQCPSLRYSTVTKMTKMSCFTIYAIHAINAKIVVKWCKHFTKMISYALYTFFYSYKSFFMK